MTCAVFFKYSDTSTHGRVKEGAKRNERFKSSGADADWLVPRRESVRRAGARVDDLHLVDWSADHLSDTKTIWIRQVSRSSGAYLANHFHTTLYNWHGRIFRGDVRFCVIHDKRKHPAARSIPDNAIFCISDLLADDDGRLCDLNDIGNCLLSQSYAWRVGGLSAHRPLDAADSWSLKWQNDRNHLC